MSWLFIILSFLGGAALALQAGVNGEISNKLGGVETAFLAYFVGTLFLLAAVLSQGGFSFSMPSISLWKWLIGALGAFYIFCIILSVPRIGTSAAITAGIAGQLLLALLLDHFGAFGTPKIPIDMSRLTGLAFIFSALWLFYR
ncbi:DMT family transporter [Sinobaca sp. H24]|uniref:DMT family transporter n=1 Tax=Sinobaca sp. H24 TaxID=2923376 RepID=UPI00207AB3F6|nr:DMT family transporter [Sinobaca sp. H24]